MSKTLATTEPSSDSAEFRHAFNKAQDGDVAAARQCREMLEADPSLWGGVGDLATTVEISWLRTSLKNDLGEEAIRRRLAQMRAELGMAEASPLERLCIQRVSLTWLTLHLAEMTSAQGKSTSRSLAQSDFYDRRVTQAQRRHLAAIRCLATVRRLLAPAGPRVSITADQVNVAADGGQQVNTTGAGAGRPQLGGAPR